MGRKMRGADNAFSGFLSILLLHRPDVHVADNGYYAVCRGGHGLFCFDPRPGNLEIYITGIAAQAEMQSQVIGVVTGTRLDLTGQDAVSQFDPDNGADGGTINPAGRRL